jgi:hypothetical protein
MTEQDPKAVEAFEKLVRLARQRAELERERMEFELELQQQVERTPPTEHDRTMQTLLERFPAAALGRTRQQLRCGCPRCVAERGLVVGADSTPPWERKIVIPEANPGLWIACTRCPGRWMHAALFPESWARCPDCGAGAHVVVERWRGWREANDVIAAAEQTRAVAEMRYAEEIRKNPPALEPLQPEPPQLRPVRQFE